MLLVERHIIKGDNKIYNICIKSKKLYNKTLYYLRQSFFGNIQRFGEYELTALMAEFNDSDYRELPAQVSQQIIKQCFRNWRHYFLSLKKWKLKSSKFNGKPKMPKYKKEQFAVYFTGQKIKLKNGEIHFPKMCISPIKTKSSNIRQVRISPQATCHIIEVVYEKEVTDLKLDKNNILSLDLGLSNLATSANNVGLRPFIINGNVLKSFNQWFNKRNSFLQSVLKGKRYNSKRLKSLIHYRNCWMDDKIHKISRFIINYCIKYNIGAIVVGKNTDWKRSINIGTKNNQHFTNMPLSSLVNKIKYKAELIGIRFLCNEESYTSKCDSLALEPVQKHETYIGKRVKRGLFQSSSGKLINADVNGACNIARKVFGDEFMKTLLNSSIGQMPYRVQIL